MMPSKPFYEFNSVFASSIRDYLDLRESLGFKTVVAGNLLRQFDRYCCSIGIEQASLTNDLVDDWLALKSGEKAGTRSHRVSELRGFAKHFASTGGDVSWAPSPIKIRHPSRYVPYIFSKQEIERMLSAADSMSPPYGFSRFHLVFPAVLRVLYSSGLRISETLALKVKDVDLDNGGLTIPAAKFGKARKLPISNSLLAHLRNYRISNADFIGIDEDGWFFPTAKGECYSQRTVYDKFRTILWQAGISHGGKGKGPRLHDLRHTFAVHSLQQNVAEGNDIYASLTRLMTYLGHSRISSTEYYLRLTAEVFPDFLNRADIICSRAIPKGVLYEE